LSEVKQNIRIRFSKRGDIRFISHHDLMRLFQRAVRRAGLPVAISEGYNPRPRLSFPMALSVGFAGLNEVADLGLSEWTRPTEVRRRLEAELPPGIEIVSLEVTRTHPKRQPQELAYRAPLLPGHGLTENRLQEFMAADSITVERRRKEGVKEVDVRRFTRALRLNGRSLTMLLDYTQDGTARPEEVLEALGCREGHDYRLSEIERTRVGVPASR
jgi:radical SAM-linked protein